MKTFKNKVMNLGLAVVMMAIGLNYSGSSATTQNISVSDCKTEVFDCGWFDDNDHRTICHTNGNGLSCNCGESSKCNDEPTIKQK